MGVRIAQLNQRDEEALRALLAQDVVQNLYVLGLLEEYGITGAPSGAPSCFHGAFRDDDTLMAAMFVGGRGGLVVPSASPAADVMALAAGLHKSVFPRASLGDQLAVEALLRGFQLRPRVSVQQRLFSVSADDLGPFTNPTLRLATEADLEALVPLAADAVHETFRHDPRAVDPAAFRARVAQRVRSQRTYVLPVDGQLVFKVDVGSRSPHGAELEGLYTLPEHRRMGHAILSLGQISRHLLASLPRLTLRVSDEDGAIAKMARRVGYVARKTQRMVIVEP